MTQIDPNKHPQEAAAQEEQRKAFEALFADPVPGKILGVDVQKASTFHIILLVPAALMHRMMCRIPLRYRLRALSFFGISAMISPLFLWMAATKWLLALLLGYALFSILVCWLVVMFSPEDQL